MSGCRKENLFLTQLDKDEDVLNSKKKELATSQSSAIKVEDARRWFEKQISQNTSANSAIDSLLILPNATPVWQSAINDVNLSGKEFLVLPLDRRISGGPGDTRLLVTRDSANNLVGAFMIYVADRDYHNATNGSYHLNDFKGDIIYLDINGRFTFGYKVRNGQVVGAATASLYDGRSGNSIQPRTCTTSSYAFCIVVAPPNQVGIVTATSDCLLEFQITSTDCPPDPGVGLGGGVGTTGGSTGSIGTSDGGGGIGSILPPAVFTAGEMNALRIKYINNGLEDVWLDYLKNDQTLLQATEAFLNAKGGFTWQNKAMLLNLIPASTNLTTLAKYFQLLAFNNDFYNANLAANFPVSTVITFGKYTDAGFMDEEFADLFSDQALFQEIDEVANTDGMGDSFAEEVRFFKKLNSESPEFANFSNQLNVLSGGSGNPLVGVAIDLMIEGAAELAGHALGLSEINELKSLLSNINFNGAKKAAFRACRVVVKFLVKKNVIVNTATSILKAKQIYDKISKVYTVFDKFQDMPSDVLKAVFNATKSKFGGLFGKIEWIDANTGAKIIGGGSDLFQKIVSQLGSSFSVYPNGVMVCQLRPGQVHIVYNPLSSDNYKTIDIQVFGGGTWRHFKFRVD